MFTRVVRRERPRRTVWALLVAAAIASLVVSAVALALINDSGTYSIEVANKTLSSNLVPLTATPGDGSALAKYIGSSAQDQASGTGLFDPFVRLQGSPTEKGYNTCSGTSCGGDVTQFDTKTGTWTHPIKASAIPVVPCEVDSSHTGTEQCWELFNDINEGNNAKHISLTKVEIYFTQNANGIITNYPFSAAQATLQYQFTGELKINDVNQGSGRGDLLLLVPVQASTAADWFVLYSEWGSTDSAGGGDNYSSEGGFEEWKVRKTPNVSIVKTADAASVNAGQSIGFTITVTNSGVADATGVTINDPLPSGSGVSWSESSPDCSIAGTPQVLTCGPVTLAPGASLSVHVTSNTTAASCGTYDNTANYTSTNAGFGSDSDLITVNCGALQITKTAKHADTSGNTSANLVATFTIVDALGNSRTLTTNAAGKGCVAGLAIGTATITETSVPTGYSAPTIPDANVVAGTCSGAELGTGGVNVNVTNTPLTTIAWSVDSLRDGATSTTVTCRDGAGNVITGYPVTVSDGDGSLPNLPPTAPGTTVTCSFVVDP